jgi:hypothetical protein
MAVSLNTQHTSPRGSFASTISLVACAAQRVDRIASQTASRVPMFGAGPTGLVRAHLLRQNGNVNLCCRRTCGQDATVRVSQCCRKNIGLSRG